ncbi:toxin C-terminal domain-containing protein [Nocardiopsis coralliicola]
MRWVWRAEAGGFKVEYGAVVLLVAAVVAAVLAFGLPTNVRHLYVVGLCRIDPDAEDCDALGPPDQGEADSPPASSESPAPPSPSNDSEEGAEDEEEDPDNDPEILYDPAFMEDFEALQDANNAVDSAESEYDNLDEELMGLLLDLMGVEDARACLTEGDIIACLSTIVSFTPWGKGLKAIKTAPKIAKLFSRWKKLKKARDEARSQQRTARERMQETSGSCPISPQTSNRMVPADSFGTIDTLSATITVAPAYTQASTPIDLTPVNSGSRGKRCTPLTKSQLTDMAKYLGYKPTKKNAKWGKVWENKKGSPRYIAFDKDQHNGEFKGASSSETLEKGKRDGSYKVVVDSNGAPQLEWVKD